MHGMHFVQWIVVVIQLSYGTCNKKLYKADEFRGNSVQLPAELQYYFHEECLQFPQNDTSLSADLSLQS